MNFLIDMNVPPSWADFLTGAGHTAVDWSDEGPPDAPDRDVFAWAAERRYILLTADIESDAALAGAAPSIIILPCDVLTPEALGHAVLAAIHRWSAELAAGVVIAVDEDPTRSRVLSRKHA